MVSSTAKLWSRHKGSLPADKQGQYWLRSMLLTQGHREAPTLWKTLTKAEGQTIGPPNSTLPVCAGQGVTAALQQNLNLYSSLLYKAKSKIAKVPFDEPQIFHYASLLSNPPYAIIMPYFKRIMICFIYNDFVSKLMNKINCSVYTFTNIH